MALVISKHVELKAGVLIRRFLDESKKIIDGQILNEMPHKILKVKTEPTSKMKEIIQKLLPPH